MLLKTNLCMPHSQQLCTMREATLIRITTLLLCSQGLLIEAPQVSRSILRLVTGCIGNPACKSKLLVWSQRSLHTYYPPALSS